jgi:hypothetical protein
VVVQPALSRRSGSGLEIAIGIVAVLATLAVGLVGSSTADPTVLLVVIAAIGLGVAWQGRIALYVMFGFVLLFESDNADPLMAPGSLLNGTLGKSSGASGFVATPLEILLLLTILIWLVKGLASRNLGLRGGQLGVAMGLFAVALAAGLVRGLVAGGDPYLVLWESRWLFYIPICYFLAASLIRTTGQLQALMTMALVAIGLFAIEGAYRRVALIDTGVLAVSPESWYSHESVIFLTALIMLVVGQQAFGTPARQRLIGLVVGPTALYTLLASERRAGVIALLVAFAVASLVLLVAKRRAFLLMSLPVALAFGAYLPVFWNNTGILGQPARAIRSLSAPDARDASSNLARDLELINVTATIEADPLLGVGFGRPFLTVVATPDISWFTLWNYEAHRNVLWIWLKTGAGGFVAFLFLIGSALALGATHVKASKRPTVRLFALFALCGVVATLVFSYVDLGLTSGRVTLFIGVVLGTLGVLDRIEDA